MEFYFPGFFFGASFLFAHLRSSNLLFSFVFLLRNMICLFRPCGCWQGTVYVDSAAAFKSPILSFIMEGVNIAFTTSSFYLREDEKEEATTSAPPCPHPAPHPSSCWYPRRQTLLHSDWLLTMNVRDVDPQTLLRRWASSKTRRNENICWPEKWTAALQPFDLVCLRHRKSKLRGFLLGKPVLGERTPGAQIQKQSAGGYGGEEPLRREHFDKGCITPLPTGRRKERKIFSPTHISGKGRDFRGLAQLMGEVSSYNHIVLTILHFLSLSRFPSRSLSILSIVYFFSHSPTISASL